MIPITAQRDLLIGFQEAYALRHGVLRGTSFLQLFQLLTVAMVFSNVPGIFDGDVSESIAAFFVPETVKPVYVPSFGQSTVHLWVKTFKI